MVDGVRSVTLLSHWVISLLKTEENVKNKKNDYSNFEVMIQDYNTTKTFIK